MAKRVQSPSSINTHKQCPRKYFYQYILKYPTKENIYCIRGNVVHDTLEKFFSIEPSDIDAEDYKRHLSLYLKNLFDAYWNKAAVKIRKTGLADDRKQFFYDESTHMLANWINHLFADLEVEIKKGKSFKEAFLAVKPHALEEHYKDEELMVRGYIDVIQKDGDDVLVIDYKTSKSSEMKKEYMLQLGIYALLYEKKHGVYPTKVGLWFLKDKLRMVDVTPQLVKDALFDIEQIHVATESDCIADYPKKRSPLCKWSAGQCDFYEICMKDGKRF